MKVIITNATGSQQIEALLDKDSGVIEFKDGEISHILYEKQFVKTVKVVKEQKAEKVPHKHEEEAKAPSEQSKKGKKAASK